ncbi:hypothetical protein LTR99_009615 [Exophiala xenobiotica]|uniref:Uncharacterized protein n=1 Tax=Vermiconidia calcicola TaxID=1690605 RepID=A0AAV9Q0A6_9PEZI|nr:hypothetical protein LTR92_007806 [Exophiala xenobiotica]KAK5530453.1 hypothetical protein LTR25_009031 [Vermiconidia calcicola]KAK5539106.1 hypothetical protein LTR23_006920 [Chaetothyriales sp. CCFEE 6169]KAK5272085.1 hypothetical protein LTR96_001715 [Exophiala xenobiotica]KAK5294217.1 hypothetical protein LTR99_009615 [Exophiala xenobiotica]
MSAVLDREFLRHLAEIHDQASGQQPPRLKWYLTTIIAFGGMNYPELIPEFYEILLKEYIPQEEQMQETRKIREGLTKLCGIWGAAKTGSATRQLLNATPEHFKDPTVYRSQESQEVAFKRGEDMLDRIYKRIPGYDMSLVSEASPDYGWIVNSRLMNISVSDASSMETNADRHQSSSTGTSSHSPAYLIILRRVNASLPDYSALTARSKFATICTG